MPEGSVRRPTLTASARAGVGEMRVGTKKRAFRSNKETEEGKKDAPLCRPLKPLLDKAPYKETALGERVLVPRARPKGTREVRAISTPGDFQRASASKTSTTWT